MALDLGLTTYQLLSALDGLAPNIQSRRRRLDDAIDRALAVPADEAAFRTAAVGRRPYIAARTGPEGLLGSQPPPRGSPGLDRAVRGRLPHRRGPPPAPALPPDQPGRLRHHLRSEPWLPTVQTNPPWPWTTTEPVPPFSRLDARGATLIAGPLLGALRTVREVERLADAVENLPDDRPVLALLDGTLAFWDLQRGNYPRYVADVLIAERLQPALARLRAASTNRRPVAVAASATKLSIVRN